MDFHHEQLIEAPPAIVWRCLTEPELRRQWRQTLVDEVPDESTPEGVGRVTHFRIRQNDSISKFKSLLVEYDPEKHLSVVVTGESLPPGTEIYATYELSPGDSISNTRLEYDVHFPLKSFFYRLLSPLIRYGLRKTTETEFEALGKLASSLASGE